MDKTDFKMNDKAYTWLALRGIATEYPDLYNCSVTNIQAGNLDWGDLMAELQQLAVTEATQPAMAKRRCTLSSTACWPTFSAMRFSRLRCGCSSPPPSVPWRAQAWSLLSLCLVLLALASGWT